jgi:hypothetical protein
MTIETGMLVMWSIAALSAQQPPGPAEPAHKVYVLTGCLEGAGAASPYRLTSASSLGQAPPPRAATAQSKPEASDVYLLQPVSGVGEQGISREGLQRHVGARVEVTVRPVEPLPSAPSASGESASKNKPEEPAPQRYTVVKIDRRADSCG